MLSPLWWFPLAVAAVAAAALWRGNRRLVDEAARLRVSIAELHQVRPLVAEVKAELAAIAATGALRVPAPSARSIPDLDHR